MDAGAQEPKRTFMRAEDPLTQGAIHDDLNAVAGRWPLKRFCFWLVRGQSVAPVLCLAGMTGMAFE